jgi:propane monooxygenase reductase subunit
MKFWAGQYVDITVTTQKGETITRSISMANTPDQTEKLSFIIKKYPEGKFSGELDSGGIKAGAEVTVVGPYGTCFRRDERQGPLILVGAGSGMSPIWSILNDHLRSGEKRPVYFFYGARTRNDLFYLDRIAELVGNHSDVTFIPVLSHANDDAEWQGERGFVHQSVDAKLKQLAVDGQGDVHACGPPPMIDALQPVLFMNGFETERIFFDKFTTSAGATPAH